MLSSSVASAQQPPIRGEPADASDAQHEPDGQRGYEQARRRRENSRRSRQVERLPAGKSPAGRLSKPAKSKAAKSSAEQGMEDARQRRLGMTKKRNDEAYATAMKNRISKNSIKHRTRKRSLGTSVPMPKHQDDKAFDCKVEHSASQFVDCGPIGIPATSPPPAAGLTPPTRRGNLGCGRRPTVGPERRRPWCRRAGRRDPTPTARRPGSPNSL